jgi:CHAT domain-containing protein
VLLNEAFTPSNLIEASRKSPAKMLHLATHAEFNAGDLPSSYLQFWDSQLTFNQIRSLGWQDLDLVILSACGTAISSPEAELGFAGLAAATGVETTIGSLWSVSDIGTLALMSEFYGYLNQSPLRVDALRRSQLALLKGETAIANQKLSITGGEIDVPTSWSIPKSADFRHPFYWAGFTLVGNPWW